MGFYDPPDTPYDELDYLNNVPVYTANPGLASVLNLSREILLTGGYYWLGIPFPSASDCLLTPRQTFSGIITVPALAYVVQLTGDTYAPGVNGVPTADDNYGFMVRVYDKGAKMESIINAQFIRGSLIAQNMQSSGVDRGKGPYFLLDPFILLKPGSLQLEITNLSPTQTKYVQFLMGLAVPVNSYSVSEVVVSGKGQA